MEAWYASAPAKERRKYDDECVAAREDLLRFARLMMPNFYERERGNLVASSYQISAWHRFFAAQLQSYADWPPPDQDLCVSVPPQHGKTQLASIFFLAWYMGRFPRRNVIFATYNRETALTIGRKVKEVMARWEYQRIFPACSLKSDAKSASLLQTTLGGQVVFVGRGGSGTGRPADLVVIDDPIKNRIEARNPATMMALWEWYNDVIETRCHRWSRKIIIHTRWVIDDLIGRLCDPRHPDHDPSVARRYRYVNIPAIVEDAELARALGLEPGSPLWPERFDLETLERKRAQSPVTFQALYMGEPAPSDGAMFPEGSLATYESVAEVPDGCEVYIGVDLAIGRRGANSDFSVLVPVAFHRETDTLWVLPNVVWDRIPPDAMVERLVAMVKAAKPVAVCAERDLIWQTIGPVLRRRMLEERAVTRLLALDMRGDKEARASALSAMVGLGRVRFPAFAPWWPKARAELALFPSGAHDDFVDALGTVARSLDAMGMKGVEDVVVTERVGDGDVLRLPDGGVIELRDGERRVMGWRGQFLADGPVR